MPRNLKKNKKDEKLERVYHCKAKLINTKADGEKGIIEAYVSVFGNVDSYGDIIEQGAFAESLNEKLPVGVWSHDWQQPIAKTLEAREDNHGLYIKGQLILGVQKAKEAYELMKAGVIDEFSIGFYIEKYEINEVDDTRIIKQINLIEWSPVIRGANSDTSLIALKGKEKKESTTISLDLKTIKDLIVDKKTGEVKIKYKNDTLSESFKISDELKAVLELGLETKAGKVLSNKNRSLVKSVISGIEELNDTTKSILAPLKTLLEATDDKKGEKVEAKKVLDINTILKIRREAKKVDTINANILRITKNK